MQIASTADTRRNSSRFFSAIQFNINGHQRSYRSLTPELTGAATTVNLRRTVQVKEHASRAPVQRRVLPRLQGKEAFRQSLRDIDTDTLRRSFDYAAIRSLYFVTDRLLRIPFSTLTNDNSKIAFVITREERIGNVSDCFVNTPIPNRASVALFP